LTLIFLCFFTGYHNTFYRVTANSDAVHANIKAVRQDNSKIVGHGSADLFRLTSVPLDSVLTEDWARQLHVVLMSISIADNMADFCIRMGNANLCKPHNEPCSEYNEFVKNEFPSINFSQTIVDLSVAHDQYPFDLPNNENESDVVEKIVESTLGREAASIYRHTVDEAYGNGVKSAALGLLSIQHIFAEFPAVVAHQTEQIILRNEKPGPYGYRWANNTDAPVTSDSSGN
jgi:hypothetical protein